jgi:hypothetical protein
MQSVDNRQIELRCDLRRRALPSAIYLPNIFFRLRQLTFPQSLAVLFRLAQCRRYLPLDI